MGLIDIYIYIYTRARELSLIVACCHYTILDEEWVASLPDSVLCAIGNHSQGQGSRLISRHLFLRSLFFFFFFLNRILLRTKFDLGWVEDELDENKLWNSCHLFLFYRAGYFRHDKIARLKRRTNNYLKTYFYPMRFGLFWLNRIEFKRYHDNGITAMEL